MHGCEGVPLPECPSNGGSNGRISSDGEEAIDVDIDHSQPIFISHHPRPAAVSASKFYKHYRTDYIGITGAKLWE